MIPAFNYYQPLTPSNTIDLPMRTQALWVGGAGDVAAVAQNNSVTVFAAVTAGQLLPLEVRRINATGTTATGIVAVYQV